MTARKDAEPHLRAEWPTAVGWGAGVHSDHVHHFHEPLGIDRHLRLTVRPQSRPRPV